MKLLFIITGLNRGGAELMLLRLIENLEQKFDITVITLSKNGELLPLFREKKITTIELSFSRYYFSVVEFFRLLNFIKINKPDVVQTWMYHADLLGGLAAKLSRVKKIYWGIRHSNIDKKKTSWRTRVVVTLCSYLSYIIPNKIISCSNNSITIHKQIGYSRKKFIHIPNGIDTTVFFKNEQFRKQTRNTIGLGDHDFVVGMLARFDPQKNHFGMLKVASKLSKSFSNIKFVFAGSSVDSMNTELMTEADDLGLEIGKTFFLLGSRPDVPELLNAFDILVCPSLYGEAFPNVVAESMACEIPCVATDVGDASTIIGESGVIVPSGDLHKLENAISHLYSISEIERRALGKLGRDRINSFFSIKNIAVMYQNIYSE